MGVGEELRSEQGTGRSGSTVSPFPLSFPQLLTHYWATVGSHREGKVEGEPCSETAQSHCQKEETREPAFWSCRGRPVGVLSTKGTKRERRVKQGKNRSRHKRWKKHPAPPERRQSHCVQGVRAGGCRGTGPRGPSLLLPSSHSLPPFWRSPGLFPALLSQPMGQVLLLRLW